MEEVVKHLPDLEGEFVYDKSQWENVASGFYCKRCLMPLLVGVASCPGCHWVFSCPTPPREGLRLEFQIAMLYERIPLEEVERIRKSASNRKR